jgi:uncharacterized protein YigE (DUF2233 family)
VLRSVFFGDMKLSLAVIASILVGMGCLINRLSAADDIISVRKPITDLPQQTGTIQRVLWQVSDHIRGEVQIVVLQHQRFQVHLIDQSASFPLGFLLLGQMREGQENAILAINGGYFDPQFKTLGLLRMAGETLQPVSEKDPLSGIIAIDLQGALTLGLRDLDLSDKPYAIQAGPYLIDPGGVMGVRPTPARAARTIIATNAQQDIILITAKLFTLHEMATFLITHKELLGGLPIERALNLDGGPSTGMACVLTGWDMVERGPVRNVLVFTALPSP